MLAKWMINKWQSIIGLQLNKDPNFIKAFNSGKYIGYNLCSKNEWLIHIHISISLYLIAWADNADSLSIAYSSTRALKTDYTR